MSYEQIRQDIVTEIERARAAWTAYTLGIDYDNRDETDLAAMTNPAYLMVDILWGDVRQMDLGIKPLVTNYGSIILAAGNKEGNGTAELMKLLQHFLPYLQLRSPIGSVRTYAGKLGEQPVRRNGMYYQTLSVPWWSVAVAPDVPA